MFNGIVQGIGRVAAIDDSPGYRRLSIAWSAEECCDADALSSLRPGASVAVNGACLTVAAVLSDGSAEFELSERTIELTALGRLSEGSRVNLEAALRMGQTIDGHLLSGHIDGVGHCRLIGERGESARFDLEIPAPLRRFVAANGAVAVDGVSLTVNELTGDGCRLTIVPFTLKNTLFGALADNGGERFSVNIEVDMLARYVAKSLEYLPAGAPTPAISSSEQP